MVVPNPYRAPKQKEAQARALLAKSKLSRTQPPRHAPMPAPPPPAADNGGAPLHWIKNTPAVVLPSGQPATAPVTLYAVIGTWFEEDVIAATVHNCFANGCSRVFIVDNNSPDETCTEATRAGAVIAEKYATKFYDDDLRLMLMNRVMSQTTVIAERPSLWWLSLDADEFPCGPHGERVIDYLATLDPVYNCVGANAIDLYPTKLPHYARDQHPADYMDEGTWRRHGKGVFCASGHWKHPLLRAGTGAYVLAQTRGSHVPFSPALHGAPLLPAREPAEEIIMFHAPFRTKEASQRRLQALCGKQTSLAGHHRSAVDDVATSSNGAIKRWRSLEAVYAGRWDKVEMPHSQQYGRNITGITLYPWQRLLQNKLRQPYPRWYEVAGEVPVSKSIELPLV